MCPGQAGSNSDIAHDRNTASHSDVSRLQMPSASTAANAVFEASPAHTKNGIHMPVARPFLEMHVLRRLTDSCHAYTQGSIVCLHVSCGLIVAGFSDGVSLVFDLAQRLRCVLRPHGAFGEVSALAISHDGSYAGAGYATGHVVLYDLLEDGAIARHVRPANATEVNTGRHEGHMDGSRIVRVQFIGPRRTAIVTADTTGLCLYHSLGRMFGFSSNDTHLLSGDYESSSILLDIAALPPGAAHLADEHLFVALLANRRIHLLGLAPTPRTWYTSDPGVGTDGALAWFPATASSKPTLAAALGCSLRIVTIRPARVKSETGKSPAVLIHTETLQPTPEPIVRLQWIHHALLFVATQSSWLLYDFAAQGYTEWQPHDPETVGTDPTSLFIWRSRGFCLANDKLYVGRLVPWDDRLTKLAASGEYIQALEYGVSLYNGEGLGSAIGLPTNAEERKGAIAERLEGLQVAACRHVFRTGGDTRMLARALVSVVAATGADELTNEWYNLFEVHGAEDVLVASMEEYILQGALRRPPPAGMQRLLDYCAREHQYARLESLVLHVEPTNLDLEQTLQLCGAHHLWDALIYIYNVALRDYVTPITVLLRGALLAHNTSDTWIPNVDRKDAYVLFPYLNAILRGLSYPHLEPMPAAQAEYAAAGISDVLYSEAPDAGLLDEKYPMLVMGLQLDAEKLLGVLDDAFECGLLSDDEPESTLPSRAHVISVLLDVRRVGNISKRDAAFIAVFVARNAPKFPQFVRLAGQDVAELFDELCVYDGAEPRAVDREFALECLLSANSLPVTQERTAALQESQFWHVLETVLRRAHDWDALLCMYMHGHPIEAAPGKLYERGIIVLQAGAHSRVLCEQIEHVQETHLGDLSLLADGRIAHSDMLAQLSERRQFCYLQSLFTRGSAPTTLASTWISLVAMHSPHRLIELVDMSGADVGLIRQRAIEHGIYDALIWACDRLGCPAEGLLTFGSFCAEQGRSLAVLAAANVHAINGPLERALQRMNEHVEGIGKALRTALRVVSRNANDQEMWYLVLHALLEYFGALGEDSGRMFEAARASGHELLEGALAAMAAAPPDSLSFPTLLERLLTTTSNEASRTAVRAVVDGILGAHRLRSDVLTLGVQLGEADVARLFRELARVRALGVFVPYGQRACVKCGLALDAARAAAANGLLWHQTCIE